MRTLQLALTVALLLALVGCGGKPAQDTLAKPPDKVPEPSLEFGGSVIRIADPKGRWTFEARSQQVKAKTAEGPYHLAPVAGTYLEKGRAPVEMSAVSGDIDKRAGRVALRGRVQISSAGWRLEADRVDYDLGTGKVVSPGRTKLTFQPSAEQSGRSEGAGR